MYKSKLMILAAVSVLTFGVFIATSHAEMTGTSKGGYPDTFKSDTNKFQSRSDADRYDSRDMYRSNRDMGSWQAFRLNKMVGTTLKNDKGQTLGRISDFVVDSEGHVVFALVSPSGFSGAQQKTVAVPFDALYHNGPDQFSLDISRRRLASAPAFTDSALKDQAWANNVYRFFGLTPHWSEMGGDFRSPYMNRPYSQGYSGRDMGDHDRFDRSEDSGVTPYSGSSKPGSSY